MGIMEEYEIFLEEIFSPSRIPPTNSTMSTKAHESSTSKRKKALETEALNVRSISPFL